MNKFLLNERRDCSKWFAYNSQWHLQCVPCVTRSSRFWINLALVPHSPATISLRTGTGPQPGVYRPLAYITLLSFWDSIRIWIGRLRYFTVTKRIYSYASTNCRPWTKNSRVCWKGLMSWMKNVRSCVKDCLWLKTKETGVKKRFIYKKKRLMIFRSNCGPKKYVGATRGAPRCDSNAVAKRF